MEEIVKLKAELAELRKVTFESVHNISNELDKMLNIFNSDDGHTMIPFKDLKLSQIGKKYFVNSNVYFVKYAETKDVLKFNCYMNAGGTFGIQEHDCLEETTIIKGHLIEYFRKDKIYHEGETVTYLPNEIHKPFAEIESIYDVIFTKNPK